jgi:hypothetical protein
MKRPQFSLRLLFLFVALAAALFAWRKAAAPLERHERIQLLSRQRIELIEKRQFLIHEPAYPSAKARIEVSKIDTELVSIEKELNDLHPGPTDY